MKRAIVIVLLAALVAAVVAPAVQAAPQTDLFEKPISAAGRFYCSVRSGYVNVYHTTRSAWASLGHSAYFGPRSWAGQVSAVLGGRNYTVGVQVTYLGVRLGFHRWTCRVTSVW